MDNINTSTRRLTAMAMMLALIFVLSALEHMLPPLPMLPPNVRLGLSNVVTMYALFFLGWRPALLLTVMKSAFVGLTRGVIAGAISLSGGLLSILLLIIFSALLRDKISYLILSILGAIAHNIGQLIAASVLTSSDLLTFFLPVLILFGVVMGSVTGLLLRVALPLFKNLKLAGGNKHE